MKTMDEIKADDARWFKKYRGQFKRLRRAGPAEDALSIEIGDTAKEGDTLMIVVTQLEPGMRTRRGFYLRDVLVDFALRNGMDCIGQHDDGGFFILAPNQIVGGKMLS